MPTFEFEAIRWDGTLNKGTLEAADINSAVQILRQGSQNIVKLGLQASAPTSVAIPTPTQRAPAFQPWSFNPVTPVIPLRSPPLLLLFTFFSQLRAMVDAGVGLTVALDTLRGQSRDGELRRACRDMSLAASSGGCLSDVMVRYPNLFSPMYCNIVRAGEHGGFLVGALRQIESYLENELELQRLYRQEMAPLRANAAGAIAVLWIFGRVERHLFRGQGMTVGPKRLPGTAPDPGPGVLLKPYLGLIILLGVVLASVVVIRLLMRTPRFRQIWDAFILRVPEVGRIVRGYAEARFGLVLGLLFESGVELSTAVEMAADSCGNTAIQREIRPAGNRIRAGMSFSEALRNTRVLSPLMTDILSTGEMTGEVQAMTTKIAQHYEEESRLRHRRLIMIFCFVAFLLFAFGIFRYAYFSWGGS